MGNNNNKDKLFSIQLSQDKLKAFIHFFQPEEGEELSLEAIQQLLKKMNIVYGVKTDVLEELIKKHEFYKDYLVAEGKPSILGKDAEIEYLFPTELDCRPQRMEDGSVDYHQLNLLARVERGKVITQLIPEIEGEDGMNVLGQEIRAPKPKTKKLRFGKNVKVSQDGLGLIAAKNGHVKLEKDKVVVYDYFEVNSNVDSSTGDIQFDGTVIINGNVLTGFSISATDIEVYGVVEGATLRAKGNVTVSRGIRGMGKCFIKADGNIGAKYIENSEVISGGRIVSEAILHSFVSAKEEIIVDGKKGMISGGDVRSGIQVEAKILGSHMGTITNIDVGVDPKLLDEYNEITQLVDKSRAEVHKLGQVITLLNKKKMTDGDLDSDKQKMLVSATRNKILTSNELSKNEKRLEEIMDWLKHKNNGKVKIMGSAYPGVRVTIGNVKYYVREEIKYCTLYQDGADIKLGSYQ